MDKAGAPVGQWSSRFAFLMAAIGSSVGLGNIWKFPYMIGTGGGSAFMLVYLACVMAVGLPILIAELMLGRMGRQGPIETLIDLGRRYSGSAAWGLIGCVGVLAAVLILSFYSVVAGWSLAYIPKLLLGEMSGLTGAQTGEVFGSLLADPWKLTFWHALFMLLTIIPVARGIQAGIEKAVVWMMPLLFVLLLVLCIYAAIEGDFAAGMAYLFKPDFAAVTWDVVLAATGQAFFSLSVGLGTMLAYGAYLPANVSIPRTSLVIVFAAILTAVLAGAAIFPIVFANGLNPSEGPGLVFVTLTVAFGAMPGGALFGAVFFVLLAIAALTSSVSLLEPIVAAFRGRSSLSRSTLAWIGGIVAWVIGFLTLFSFNIWSDVHPLGGTRTWFDWIDFLTSNIMLPLGGVMLALFAGWVVSREDGAAILGFESPLLFRLWRILVRVVAPVGVVAAVVSNML
ncbi:sodium-dependent transporter [Niveispirillum sp. KHB5.9]|uniref:sodium-dependent transporter n=1 Tax=Niveispirillum sp. KHB5.9 TaxID=3400269 RepID=UPI003A845495